MEGIGGPSWIDQKPFYMKLPPGWTTRAGQGLDSYPGETIGPGIRLWFDWGQHTGPADPQSYPGHIITYEMIGGHKAQLMRPEPGQPGTARLHIEGLGGTGYTMGTLDLTIEGKDLTVEQQEIVFGIFRSVHA
jgi:hypothetical protein